MFKREHFTPLVADYCELKPLSAQDRGSKEVLKDMTKKSSDFDFIR